MHGKQELIAAASSLILALPAFAQAGMTSADRDAHPLSSATILGMLHRSNRYEIAMANLARDRSSSQAIKDYAALIISDHKKADDELQSVAAAHNIDLDHDLHAMQERHQEDLDAARSREVQSATGEYFRPMPQADLSVGGMSAEHKKAIDNVGKLKGPEFDRRFAKAMADDHRKVIDHLKTVRSNATEGDLAQLIDKLLPTLQKHETAARQLESPSGAVRQ